MNPSINIKAILFDMDGVLIDSERKWREFIPAFQEAIGIGELPEDVGSQTYGISMSEEYRILKERIGISISYEKFVATYDRYASEVYSTPNIAADLEKVLEAIKIKGITVGLVTSSLESWAKLFLSRLSNPRIFDLVLSVADTPTLKPKPAPDGYLYAMKVLNVKPENCIAIEDSNRGIKAAKSAGIYTFASKEFVDSDYSQEGYDRELFELKEILNFI